MASGPQFLFQYIQKLVIFRSNHSSVLLAKRKGEADYDGTFSFIGGKMETTDATMVDGMKREKDEEIGQQNLIRVLPNETYNVLFRKSDGHVSICPHVPAVFVSGSVSLSDEYSKYRWVSLVNLAKFEPKIHNITHISKWALERLKRATESDFVEI